MTLMFLASFTQEIVEFFKTPGVLNAMFAVLGAVGVKALDVLSKRKELEVQKISSLDAGQQKRADALATQNNTLLDQHRLFQDNIQKELDAYRSESHVLRTDLSNALTRASNSELKVIELKAQIVTLEMEIARHLDTLKDLKEDLTETLKKPTP